MALVGDASGRLDPITGEGLSVAFGQARSVVQAIQRGTLSSYEADHRRIMHMPRLLTGLLLPIERRPPVRRALIRFLAASPPLFDCMVDRVGRAGKELGREAKPC